MERNDNYSIFENPEDMKISFIHSFGFKVLIFAVIFLAYGIIIFSLFAGNMISISNEMQSISEYQSAWYSGNAAVSAAQTNLRNYLNLSDEEYLENFQATAEEISSFVALLNESGGVYAHDLAALCDNYLQAANLAIEYSNLGDYGEIYSAYENAENIQSLISIFSSYSMVEMEEDVRDRFTEQNEAMMSHFRSNVIVLLIVTVAITGIAILFFRSFLGPLEKLTALAMTTTTDTWEIREVPETRKDEVGLLFRAFYRMMNKISLQYNELLRKQQLENALQKEKEKNIQTEALLAKSELKVFQSQINSHFLFNTMNMISCLANLENAPRVQNAVQLLAQYLRTVLDQFNRIVTLTEEFESIQTYVEIQKLRFGDRIQFESDLDIDLEWFQVPAMTMQPLVENAFQHGVSSEKKGYIRCVAEKDGDDVLLYVWDDGAGITAEKCAQLLQCLTEDGMNENPEQNIGLSNVWHRLNLYYPGHVTPLIKGAENEYAQIGFRIHEVSTLSTNPVVPDTQVLK